MMWQDLVSRLTPNDAVTNNGVLEVAHSIFKRWRPLYSSDALYTEINHVLNKFSRPFLQLLAVCTCTKLFAMIRMLTFRLPEHAQYDSSEQGEQGCFEAALYKSEPYGQTLL
jgi:hypothetical protein